LDNTASLNTARRALAGAGIQTAALAFGGTTPGDTASNRIYGMVLLGLQLIQ
jgi:hypothetical protein